MCNNDPGRAGGVLVPVGWFEGFYIALPHVFYCRALGSLSLRRVVLMVQQERDDLPSSVWEDVLMKVWGILYADDASIVSRSSSKLGRDNEGDREGFQDV